MVERVRAVLVTPSATMLTIRRLRPGAPDPYWVLPGGHVEPTDASLEAALVREVREEVCGTPAIRGLLHTLVIGGERQHFYLADIASWCFEARTGPEFADPLNGAYDLEEIPLTPGGVGGILLQPRAFAVLLADALAGPLDQWRRDRVAAIPAAPA